MSRWTTSSTLDHRSRKDCIDSRGGRSVSEIHWKVSRTGCTAMARRWSLIDSEQNRRVQRQRPEDTVTRARGRPESIDVYAVSRWGRSVIRRCCTLIHLFTSFDFFIKYVRKRITFILLHKNIVIIVKLLIITAIFDKSCKLHYVHNSCGDFYIKKDF